MQSTPNNVRTCTYIPVHAYSNNAYGESSFTVDCTLYSNITLLLQKFNKQLCTYFTAHYYYDYDQPAPPNPFPSHVDLRTNSPSCTTCTSLSTTTMRVHLLQYDVIHIIIVVPLPCSSEARATRVIRLRWAE